MRSRAVKDDVGTKCTRAHTNFTRCLSKWLDFKKKKDGGIGREYYYYILEIYVHF